MLSFPAAIKVYLCTVPCDMRRSFDGLYALTRRELGEDPMSGSLYASIYHPQVGRGRKSHSRRRKLQ